MKRTIKNSVMLIAITIFLFQCGQQESPVEDAHGHEEEGEHNENEGVVALNDVQLANADLQYGQLDSLNISAFVSANGVLDLPPQNIAAVSAPMDGFVKTANYLVGDYVEKGKVLAILEHMDYIKVQEEYLDVLTNLDYLRLNYERQKQLDSAQITSKKEFQAASAAYKSAQVRKQALEKQLIYMGISPKRVAQGNISGTISIRAPFSGYITALNVHNGTFARSEQELYEMVDTDHMHLELNIFEQDVNKVKIGQPIRFEVPGTGESSYRGEVFLVGKSFNQEDKTIKVHGHIEGEHDDFIRGLYIEAKIYTEDQKVQGLPEEAIVKDGGKSYIFIRTADAHAPDEEVTHAEEAQHAEEGHGHDHEQASAGEDHGTSFQRVQVVTGVKDQGFVQIKEMPAIPASADIVTKGAYYLLSEMKKGEGGHHH